MTWTKLTSSDAGAPQLKAVNGSLTDVLRWALPLLGWTIKYGASGTAAVFEPGSGNKRLLCINNNNAAALYGGSLVRGAESASSPTSWTDVFPTTSQHNNSNAIWMAGNYANTSEACPYVFYGNDAFFYFLTYAGATSADSWELHFFGDVPTDYSNVYATVISSKGSSIGYGTNISQQMCYAGLAAPPDKVFWCRDVSGSIKSSKGVLSLSGGPVYLGNYSGYPQIRGGYKNRFNREKVGIHCNANASNSIGALALVRRGWMPNLWSPMHLGMGTVSNQDTFTDTAYNPSATFRVYQCTTGSGASGAAFVIEETDTWSKP